MDKLQLPPDFREFLLLLNQMGAKYLLIGGYAVSAHGYSRPTGDLDVWVERSEANADRLVDVFQRFSPKSSPIPASLFLESGRIIRMGLPPSRLEVLNKIAGVEFADCYPRHWMQDIGGVTVPIISLEDLLQNKRAAGRHKDLADVEELTSAAGQKQTRRGSVSRAGAAKKRSNSRRKR